MNEMERKRKRIVFKRKHVVHTYQISNSSILMDAWMPEDKVLLTLVSLRPDEVRRLHDLCEMLLAEAD